MRTETEKQTENQYFAVTTKGLEEVLLKEVKALPGGVKEAKIEIGGVSFKGPTEVLYHACLELRVASKVLLKLKEFSARNPEMLYDQVRRIAWEKILTPEMTFCVDSTMSLREHPHFRNSQFFGLKVKDALCDRMRKECLGLRPNVDVEFPDVRVHAYLNRESKCILSLDASGRSLHERGYRRQDTGAPLKETLAAGLLELAGYDGTKDLYDPMCGSGTFIIEALMIARNQAPGLIQPKFGFEKWQNFDEKVWKKVLETAKSKIKNKLDVKFFASDSHPQTTNALKNNLRAAGLLEYLEDGTVQVQRSKFEMRDSPLKRPSILITNPPYGERLQANDSSMEDFFKSIGDTLKKKYIGQEAFLLLEQNSMLSKIGLKPTRKFPVFNGPIECRLLKYDLFQGNEKERRKARAEAV